MNASQRGSSAFPVTPSPSATVRDAGAVIERSPYRGRFAPSPTGPLHFGSLVAATASYLQAKTNKGQWLVRIEDVDVPRTVPGAADLILQSLEAFGFEWDGPLLWQSQRTAAYEAALDELKKTGHVFACSCTRSELQALHSSAENEELRYPGWCREAPRHPASALAWRFRVPQQSIEFTDEVQGLQQVNLENTIGDFVVKRRDGLFAYQLAVAVDDAEQQITEVVRGADLLGNTARQIAIQRALHYSTPHYLHVPLVLDQQGHKLSKSSAAPALEVQDATPALWKALQFLRQAPPPELQHGSLQALWQWAIPHWRPQRFRGMLTGAFEV